MKSKFLLLAMLSISTCFLYNPINCDNGTEGFMNAITNWWYSPSSNDPKVIGLTVAGGTTAIVGACMLKNGIEQTLAPINSNKNSISDFGKSALSRTFGSVITVCGLGLAVGGLGLLVGNKTIITEYNKLIDGFYK